MFKHAVDSYPPDYWAELVHEVIANTLPSITFTSISSNIETNIEFWSTSHNNYLIEGYLRASSPFAGIAINTIVA